MLSRPPATKVVRQIIVCSCQSVCTNANAETNANANAKIKANANAKIKANANANAKCSFVRLSMHISDIQHNERNTTQAKVLKRYGALDNIRNCRGETAKGLRRKPRQETSQPYMGKTEAQLNPNKCTIL